MEKFAERIVDFLGLDREELKTFPGFSAYCGAFRSKQANELFAPDEGLPFALQSALRQRKARQRPARNFISSQ